MRVNVEIIRKMNPCKNRFDDNFLIYYPNFDSNLEEFLSLDRITYSDKIWVYKKLLNKNQLVHFATILCAQSILEIYQNKYPNDTRIKDCLNYLTTITDFTDLDNSQREKLLYLRKECLNGDTYAADTTIDIKTQEDLNLQFLLIASKL